MDMTSIHEHLSSLRGADVYDRDGDKIGAIGQLYTDASGQPSWASVQTGLFGLRESLVPIHQAQWNGNQLQVPYDKRTVKDAPNVDAGPDEPLQGEEIRRLYEYYDVGRGNGGTQQSGHQSAGTDRDAAGRAHLRKYLVTEPIEADLPNQRGTRQIN
jgi:hypothetical protein